MPEPEENVAAPYVDSTLKDMAAAGLRVSHSARRAVAPTLSGLNKSAFEGWSVEWYKNAFLNFPFIAQSWGISHLRNAAKKVPAVIVGIGPSLDDEGNFEALKNLRGRAVLIATDAAYRPLTANGIVPDLVVSLDASENQKSLFDDTPADVPLVIQSCTHPRTIEAWKGPLIFYHQMVHDAAFFTQVLPSVFSHVGGLNTGGTVGTASISLADAMGCDPIITIGLDLAYSERKGVWQYRCRDYRKTFVSGPNESVFGDVVQWEPTENKTLYDNAQRLKGLIEHVVDDKVLGKTAYKTDAALVFYYNALAELIGQQHLPVIDASGGMLKHVARQMPLAKALDSQCTRMVFPLETALYHLALIAPPHPGIEMVR